MSNAYLLPLPLLAEAVEVEFCGGVAIVGGLIMFMGKRYPEFEAQHGIKEW